MPDVMQQVNELKSLPDQSLQFELANPSGAVPAYLVLAEAQRRQLLRSAAQAQQSQAPIGSVYDDVIRSMMARQPQPGQAPAGMTPPPASPPSQPQNGRSPLAMAEGGEVWDENDSGNYDDLIDQIALQHGRDPNEIRAMVQAESSGDPNAVSPKGATGLLQLMPATGHQYGARNLKDPRQNLEAGVSFIDHLYDKYDDPTLVHAAYNAGEGAVDKYGGVPNYKETRKYVNKVDQLTAENAAQGEADRAVEDEAPDPQVGRPYPILGTGPVVGPPAGGIAAAVGQAPPPPSTPTGAPTTNAGWSTGSTAPTADVSDLPMPPQRGFVLPPTVMPPQPDSELSDALTGTYNTLNQMRNLPVSQNPREIALQKMIDQFYAEAQRRKKPTFWDYLTNFGLGMASTPSRNWAGSVAGGMAGMAKGVMQQKEDARKEQLQAMGVDLNLDDKLRAQQQSMIKDATDIAKTQQTATTQAQKNLLADQIKAFEDLRKVPGAIYGSSNMFDPKATDFTPTPDPRNPAYSVWSPPSMRKTPKELVPYLNAMGGNPITGQPVAENDLMPYDRLMEARKQAGQVATHNLEHRPSQAEMNLANGVMQTLQVHGLPMPYNPDGSPRDLSALTLNDLPSNLQGEGEWRMRVLRDGIDKHAQEIIADPKAPPDLVTMAKAVLQGKVNQAEAMPTEAAEKASFLAGMQKLEVERFAAGKPALNTGDPDEAAKAIRESTTLKPEEKSRMIGYLQTNFAAEARAGKQNAAEETRQRNLGIKLYAPAMASAERYNIMAENYENAVKNNDQQAMLSMLANHLGMTMGSIKGGRLNQAVISEAIKSRPWLQGMASKFDKDGYLEGVTLTPEQMRQMVDLAQSRFSQDVQTARSNGLFGGLKSDGPARVPNKAIVRRYFAAAGKDPAKAKQMMAADGWSVE